MRSYEETLAAYLREQAGPDVLREGDTVDTDIYPGDGENSFAVEIYIVRGGKRGPLAAEIFPWGVEDFLRNLHRLAQEEVTTQSNAGQQHSVIREEA